MTNGEKITALLKPREYEIKTYGDWVEIEIQRLDINFSCTLKWWNAEYKEPSSTSSTSKGYWIEHQHEAGANWEYSRYECSECHNWAEDDSNYCPCCGTEMDGVKSVKRF